MKVFAQTDKHPSQVLFAFDDVTQQSARRVRWAVAYATYKGCSRLIRQVARNIGDSDWKAAEKIFVTSLDYGITDPGAISLLASLPNSEVRIAHPDVLGRPRLSPVHAYHPKLYLFDSNGSIGYVVGSANLTERALTTNSECVIAGTDGSGSNTWDTAWDRLITATEPLSNSLLSVYKKARARPGLRIPKVEQSFAAVTISAKSQAVFWEALSAGSVQPMAFNHLWIEAGSMSSGGSHNQLELPRGANQFFGYQHANYGSKHVTIGIPRLTLLGQVWTNRPLTWHGNNRMERLNLPTKSQGGFSYKGTAVLFRRHANGFELSVFPWNDPVALAWRAASVKLGTVFRLGQGTSRVCGLF